MSTLFHVHCSPFQSSASIVEEREHFYNYKYNHRFSTVSGILPFFSLSLPQLFRYYYWYYKKCCLLSIVASIVWIKTTSSHCNWANTHARSIWQSKICTFSIFFVYIFHIELTINPNNEMTHRWTQDWTRDWASHLLIGTSENINSGKQYHSTITTTAAVGNRNTAQQSKNRNRVRKWSKIVDKNNDIQLICIKIIKTAWLLVLWFFSFAWIAYIFRLFIIPFSVDLTNQEQSIQMCEMSQIFMESSIRKMINKKSSKPFNKTITNHP